MTMTMPKTTTRSRTRILSADQVRENIRTGAYDEELLAIELDAKARRKEVTEELEAERDGGTFGELRSRAEQIQDEKIKERVIKGIALLTEEYGENWPDKIDTTYMTLSSGSSCVLGQVYGDYHVGLVRLGIEGEGSSYGFDTGSEGESYGELNDAWRKVLCR
jgi:hypothetical protein